MDRYILKFFCLSLLFLLSHAANTTTSTTTEKVADSEGTQKKRELTDISSGYWQSPEINSYIPRLSVQPQFRTQQEELKNDAQGIPLTKNLQKIYIFSTKNKNQYLTMAPQVKLAPVHENNEEEKSIKAQKSTLNSQNNYLFYNNDAQYDFQTQFQNTLPQKVLFIPESNNNQIQWQSASYDLKYNFVPQLDHNSRQFLDKSLQHYNQQQYEQNQQQHYEQQQQQQQYEQQQSEQNEQNLQQQYEQNLQQQYEQNEQQQLQQQHEQNQQQQHEQQQQNIQQSIADNKPFRHFRLIPYSQNNEHESSENGNYHNLDQNFHSKEIYAPQYNEQNHNKEIEKILENMHLSKLKSRAEAEAIANSPPVVIHKDITITRRRPINIINTVHVPVPSPVLVPIPQIYKQYIPQPYAVPMEVIRPYIIPIEKTEKIEVEKPVPVEVQKIVHVPVEKKVYVKVDKPVTVQRTVPVEITKKIPVKIPLYKPQKLTILRHVWKH